MTLSDRIAQLIEEMLNEGSGSTEVKRNDLAAQLGCVPSQINYVITSRFTPERGYMTESRRGGGGYIRIVRVQMTRNQYLMHFFHAIGDSIDEPEGVVFLKQLADNKILTDREAAIAAQAISRAALERVLPETRNNVRADILKHIIMLQLM